MDIPNDSLVEVDTFYAGLERLQFLSCRCCMRFTPFLCYLPPQDGIRALSQGLDLLLLCPGCIPRPQELAQIYDLDGENALCRPELLKALKGFEYQNPFFVRFARFPRTLLTIETRVNGQLPAGLTGLARDEQCKALQQLFSPVHSLENKRYSRNEEMAAALAAKAAAIKECCGAVKHKLKLDTPPQSPKQIKRTCLETAKEAELDDPVPGPSSQSLSQSFNQTLPPYVAGDKVYKLKVLSSKSPFPCDICQLTEKNTLRYGEFIEKGTTRYTLRCHYFCLLSGSDIPQSGDTDRSGILGFLLKDIKCSFEKYRQNECSFCGQLSAAVLCNEPGCTVRFHYICGYKNGCMTQFKDAFLSYCSEHIPVRYEHTHADDWECRICMNAIGPYGPTSSFCTVCEPEHEGEAIEYEWFHRECMQHYALQAGYYFQCPNCFEKTDFPGYARERGIFVPMRDATWELEKGAYKDIHKCKCTAENCRFSDRPQMKGEVVVDGGKRQLVSCKACGGSTMHMACAGVQDADDFCCAQCMDATFIKLF